ncbi:MAG: N-acetylglucosamine-6-phosphate deacetylase [Bryobacteraceae bacterium]
MKCYGTDPSSGAYVEITYDNLITGVDHPLEPEEDGVYVAPGWIDLQVNGYAGVDYNSQSTPHEEIARSIHVLYSTGTTRFYPTVITGAPDEMTASLRNLAKARERLPEGAAMEGFHVEGPHISPEDGPRGAHPQRWVRPPDVNEYRRWQEATDGQIRLVTLSPEWPEAPAYIEALVQDGVVISIGHTKATAEQIQDAVRAGATKSTHIGNGAHSLLSRHPNYIWEQLAEDRLSAGMIVDGIHLGTAFIKVALRAKGVARTVLVTDASAPACGTPGIYKLGGQEVELTPDNRVVLRGQSRLAGSALRMDHAIENIMRFTNVPLVEALAMASRNPARVGRVAGRQRGLATGERADLVQFLFDPQRKSIEILKTIVGGREVYSAKVAA